MGISGPLPKDGKPVSETAKFAVARKDAFGFHAMPAIPEEIEMSEVGLSGAQKAMELLAFALGSDGDTSDADSELSQPEADDQKLLYSPARGNPKVYDMESLSARSSPGRLPLNQLRGSKTGSGSIKATGQEPILKLGSSGKRAKPGRVVKLMFFLLFIAVNVVILTGILALAFSVANLTEAVVITVAFGFSWIGLFIFNLYTASQRESVIHKYWMTKRSSLLPLKEGKIVILVGKVSALDETVDSDFRKDGGFIMVDTCLKSIVSRHDDYCVYKDHVKQVKSADFKVTDAVSGVSIVVEASSASKDGFLSPLLVPMVSIPLKVTPDVAPFLKKRDSRRKAMANTQYYVHEGYVFEGQTVTVMGCLKRSSPGGDLVLGPINHLKNISWFLLFHGFLPFFCPVWVRGLVIMD